MEAIKSMDPINRSLKSWLS